MVISIDLQTLISQYGFDDGFAAKFEASIAVIEKHEKEKI